MPNNPISATYLFGSTGGKFGPYAYAFLGVTVVILALCITYYSTLGKNRFHGHGLRAKLADRAALYVLIWDLVTLFFFMLRLLHVPAVSTRFVFVLLALAILALVGYYVYYYRTRYPVMLAEYEDQRRRLRYIPAASLPKAVGYHASRRARKR